MGPIVGLLLVIEILLFSQWPMRTHALVIKLPWLDYAAADLDLVPEPQMTVIGVSPQGRALIDGKDHTIAELDIWLSEAGKKPERVYLIFEPAADAPYGEALGILAMLRDRERYGYLDFCFGDLRRYRNLGEKSSPFPLLLSLDLPDPHFAKRCGGLPWNRVDSQQP